LGAVFLSQLDFWDDSRSIQTPTTTWLPTPVLAIVLAKEERIYTALLEQLIVEQTPLYGEGGGHWAAGRHVLCKKRCSIDRPAILRLINAVAAGLINGGCVHGSTDDRFFD
jgi:hypothetical protein